MGQQNGYSSCDFNVRSTTRSDTCNNPTGSLLGEIMAALDLACDNEGTRPIFVRERRTVCDRPDVC